MSLVRLLDGEVQRELPEQQAEDPPEAEVEELHVVRLQVLEEVLVALLDHRLDHLQVRDDPVVALHVVLLHRRQEVREAEVGVGLGLGVIEGRIKGKRE